MISMKTFYGLAGILMVISVGGSIWNLFNIWNFITLGAKIATIAGNILFQSLLAWLFISMYKNTPDLEIQDTNLDNLVKEIQESNIKSKQDKRK